MTRRRKVRRWSAGIDGRGAQSIQRAREEARAAGLSDEEYLRIKMAELRSRLEGKGEAGA